MKTLCRHRDLDVDLVVSREHGDHGLGAQTGHRQTVTEITARDIQLAADPVQVFRPLIETQLHNRSPASTITSVEAQMISALFPWNSTAGAAV